MTGLVGHLALWAAVLAAAGVLAACAAAWGTGRDQWLIRARWALRSLFVAISAAGGALLVALLRTNLRFEYVAAHSERALAPAYKLAALWAGQEGSLLLWAWLVAGLGTLMSVVRRDESSRGEAVTLGILAGISGYFTALLALAADPFLDVVGGVPADGSGLNPLLQHWAMVAHPPVLFLGYAGFAAPFAIAMGALAAGRRDDAWVGDLRRWTLAAWMFQGAGISLGAYWAYVELGWGGYWAWDPVENASLLPWLSGAALLHILPVHQRSGRLRGWTAPLASLTFVLCIIGTWLTRSGIVQSVHAFGQSPVGAWFLVLLAAAAIGSAGLILARRRLMVSERGVERVFSREGAVMLGAVLLVVMALTTLAGTVAPVVTGLLGRRAISVGAGYYNHAVVPLAIACGGLMAIGPMLGLGPAGSAGFGCRAAVPGIVAGAASLAALVFGLRDLRAHACLILAAFAISAIALDFVLDVWRAAKRGDAGPLWAVLGAIDGNHRRHGGRLAHAGMALVFIGVAASSLLSSTQLATLHAGETAQLGGSTFRLDDLREFRGPNYTAVQADVTLTGPDGRSWTLGPQRRFYDRSIDGTATVAIRSSLRQDVYIALVGWEAGGTAAAIQARIIPMAIWIWIGAGTTAAGAGMALMPRLFRRSAAAATPARVRIPAQLVSVGVPTAP